MKTPKIETAKAIDDHTLLIIFDNQQKKKYDMTHLLNREMFTPLKNIALFKSVRVEQGGFGVVWTDSIDISEFELWKNGQIVPA